MNRITKARRDEMPKNRFFAVSLFRGFVIVGCSMLFFGALTLRLGWKLRGAEVDQKTAEVRALVQRAELMEEERDFWKRRATGAQEALIRSRQRIVEVSAYTASRRECDADPHIAASMLPPRPGTVAVSRDLFRMGWTHGKTVHLKGLGAYTINDVMHPRFRMRVDVFVGEVRQAREFGVRTTEAILG